jgi:hypothetical protein
VEEIAMVTLETLEERVRSLEQEVAQLRAISSHQPSRNRIESMIGIMADCPGFEDVVRYGREFRNSDRPGDLDDA